MGNHELELLQQYEQETGESIQDLLEKYFFSFFFSKNQNPTILSLKIRTKQSQKEKQGKGKGRGGKKGGGNEGGGERETFEEMLIGNAKIFHRFTKKIDLSPYQLIRYSFGGEPLWFNSLPKGLFLFIFVHFLLCCVVQFLFNQIEFFFFLSENPPKCWRCGASTIFEYQIVSTLPALESSTSHLNIGTILVSSCSRGCFGRPKKRKGGHVNVVEEENIPEWLVEEWVMFQIDEMDREIDGKLSKKRSGK